MAPYTPDFTLDVAGINGLCPAGEAYAKQTIAEKRYLSSLVKDLAFAERLPDWLPTWWRMIFRPLRAHVMQRRFLYLTRLWRAG
jgi:hypothetical protein